MDGHDAHARYVVGCKGTEVLWFVVLLDDPVIYPSDGFHKVSQSSSIVRRAFVNKLVLNKRPDSFILMHMRAIVKVNKSFAFKLS